MVAKSQRVDTKIKARHGVQEKIKSYPPFVAGSGNLHEIVLRARQRHHAFSSRGFEGRLSLAQHRAVMGFRSFFAYKLSASDKMMWSDRLSLRWFAAPVGGALRLVFGRDVFISYSRKDSGKYAPALVLALKQKNKKLSFYLDRWIAESTLRAPISLERHLRWSGLMVVICTEHATSPESFVRDEIRQFGGLGRKMIPIDVGGYFGVLKTNEELWPLIGGEAPEFETDAAISEGRPSDAVVERILNAIDFTTQQRRLEYSVWSTLVLMAGIIGGSAVYSSMVVTKAHDATRQARLEAAGAKAAEVTAVKNAGIATEQQKEAEKETAAAELEQRNVLGHSASLLASTPGNEQKALEDALGAIAPGRLYKGAPPLAAMKGLADAASAVWYSLPLEGTVAGVKSARFTPDGSLLIADFGGKKVAWSTVSGKKVAIPPHEPDPYKDHSGDGSDPDQADYRLDIAGDTATVRDAATGAAVSVLAGFKGSSVCYAFSSHGELLATGTREGALQAWNTKTGKVYESYAGHATEPPTFERFVSLDQLQNPEQLQKMDGKVVEYSSIGINWVAFSRDARLLISAGNDRTARIWYTGFSSSPAATLGGHDTQVTYADFSPSSTYAVSASEDGLVRLWLSDGRPLALLQYHTRPVRLVTFNAEETRLATFSDDNTGRIWRPEHDDSMVTFDDDTGPLTRARFSPDGRYIAASSPKDGFTRVWSSTSGKLIKTLIAKTDPVPEAPLDISQLMAPRPNTIVTPPVPKEPWRFGYAPHDNLGNPAWDPTWIWNLGPVFFPKRNLLLTEQGHMIVVWDTRTWKEVSRFKLHDQALRVVAISPDGSRVVSADGDHRVFLWSTASGNKIRQLEINGPVTAISFSPSGKTFATSSYGGGAAIWDGESGRRIRVLDPKRSVVNSIEYSGDGNEILVAPRGGAWTLLDSSTGRAKLTVGGPDSDQARYSPDGRRILTWSGKTATLWQAETGKVISRLAGHAFQISAATFSPDGQRIATASWDETVRLWDGQTGDEIALYRGHMGRVYDVSFSPDGNFLLSADMDGTAKIFPASLEQFIARAKAAFAPLPSWPAAPPK
jgi:WD40 repeat protein